MTETICVDAGICKLKTVITPKMDDMGNMEFEVKSQCPNVTKLFAAIGPINAYTEVAAGFADSELYKKAAECIPHVACPVPCATVKAMEVVGGLALKREVSIRFLSDGEDPDLRRPSGRTLDIGSFFPRPSIQTPWQTSTPPETPRWKSCAPSGGSCMRSIFPGRSWTR